MVLTIHVVRQGGHHYYVHDLVPGRAEGGLVAGEEPGVWTGAGVGSLGLAGEVGSADFAEVLEGRDPCSGRSLRRRQGDRSSAGFDLTFCAPKSVSLLHLLAPGEIERRGRGRPPGGRGRRPRLPGAGGCRGPAHPTGGRWPSCPPPGRWPERSSTGPAVPSIPTSTPTWWWPTWPRVWTGPGPAWTVGGSTPISPRPSPSTTPVCDSSSATAWAQPGSSGRRGWATWSVWSPACGDCSPSERPRWTSTTTDGWAVSPRWGHRRPAPGPPLARRLPSGGAHPGRFLRRPPGEGHHGHRRPAEGRVVSAGRRVRVRPRGPHPGRRCPPPGSASRWSTPSAWPTSSSG